MIRTVDEVVTAQAVGRGVVASGRTERGLRVSLVEFDPARVVAAPSEFEEFPEGTRVRPAGLDRLLVEVADDAGGSAVAGSVSWHAVHYGPNEGSRAWNIGIGLAPAARGHGVGTVAQRLLAEWLLRTTDVARVEASTDVTNVAEQRALERAGFTREGVLRSAQERVDGRHDLYSYSLLRSDLEDVDRGV